MNVFFASSVIPAKAGTHQGSMLGREVSWAPAFAGVTTMGVSQ